MTIRQAKSSFIQSILPDPFPQLAPATDADLGLLMRWLAAGRSEGAFRTGPPPTASSVRRYRDELASRVDEYHVRMIHHRGRPVGYLDFSRVGSRGELIGLYIAPKARGLRIGSMAAELAIEELARLGAKSVSALIFEDNAASSRLFRSLAFARSSRARPEDSRPVWRWMRRLAARPRLQPANPLAAALSGENHVIAHAAAGMLIARRFLAVPGVEAVLGLGSIARGFGDQYSDIDILVLGRGESIQAIATGEHFISGTSIDLFAVDRIAAPIRSWSLERREAVMDSVVLASSREFSPRSLARTCRLSRREQRSMAVELLLQLGWVGCHPPAWDGSVKHGYDWCLPPDVWRHRGQSLPAHLTVDYAFDLVLRLVYLLNGRIPPDPKWRLHLTPGLPWTPRSFHSLRDAILLPPRVPRTLDARLAAVRSLAGAAARRASTMGLLGKDMYRQWTKTATDYRADV